ncbi:MAG: F0F1 ATP synthase subunit B [Lachnospiraceae bacterium]|nr:F0F1 ATP synthase subunit B [Lachnospiraceae bacterium]
MMNTLAIFFVAKKFLFVPVKNMIDSRQKEIDAMYDAAGAAKESAQALENEYKEKLAQAQQTSDRMVKDAVARGQNRQDEIISQANAEARAILDKAAADIAQEKKKALNDAKNEISELAMAIAEKVVGRELNDVDQAKLVDEFINELGD